MRQNTVFSTKNTKNLSPLPKPLHREGTPPPTPHLPRYLRRLDPLHAEILGTPLYADIVLKVKTAKRLFKIFQNSDGII